MSGNRAPVAATTAELIREGEYWTVAFEDREMRVRDSKGMGYLAELLAHPEREIEVLALAGDRSADWASQAEVADAGLTLSSDPDGDPLLDENARLAYRERLRDLREEIEEADAFRDPERAASARAEYAAIADELAGATGLGGRDRRTGTAGERARLNVTRAIRSAIARVAEHDGALGEHLSTCVHTGRVCVYRPDRRAPVAWTVGRRPTPGRRAPRRMPMPDTRYARNGEISIAYQVVGEGPIDLVLVNGLAAHLDLLWADPDSTAFLRRLASFSRLILFDKPGTGLSDPVAGVPSPEQRMGDVRAVMDAAGSRRAALIGYSEGGVASTMFAATYPGRTTALVLINSSARSKKGSDFPAAFERLWWLLDELAAKCWGEGAFVLELAPSWAESEMRRRTAGIAERACASPGMVRALIDALRECDVRSVLPTISAPTLVIHATDDKLVAVELGRDLAQRIPGSRFVEVPSVDHIFFAGDWEPIASEIEELLTAELPEPKAERLLRTVVCTEVSDPAAREDHDRIARQELERFGGRPIENSGSGLLAAFDGPGSAVRCARAIAAELRRRGHEVRAGIHTGECEAGGDDLEGVTVHVAAQICALAEPSEALVSRTVCDLVAGSGIEFRDRGGHDLEGIPGRWNLYAAIGDEPTDTRPAGSVDQRTAALTPGPRDTMTRIDRVALALAKHAPGATRLVFRGRHVPRRLRFRHRNWPR
jgi:pimeloyl-ACP methyl ester carboxylesterase